MRTLISRVYTKTAESRKRVKAIELGEREELQATMAKKKKSEETQELETKASSQEKNSKKAGHGKKKSPSSAVEEILEVAVEQVEETKEALSKVVGKAKKAAQKGVEALAGEVEEKTKATKKAAKEALDSAAESAQEVVETTKKAAQKAAKETVGAATEAAQKAVKETVEAATEVAQEAVETTKKTARKSVKAVSVAAEEAFEVTQKAATEGVEASKKAVGKAANTVASVVQEASNSVNQAAQKATEAVSQAAHEASEAVHEAAQKATEAVSQVVSNATEAVSQAAHEASEATQKVISTLSEQASASVQEATQRLVDVVESAKHFAQDAVKGGEEDIQRAVVASDEPMIDPDAPEISIVIPVYNEEGIITSSVEDLIRKLREMECSYEILLAENGSRDATSSLAHNLESRFPQVRVLHVGEPNYGKALRLGILEARGQFVICDEIDLCDTRFYRDALGLLRSDAADMVVGSKLLASSKDNRGWFRHTASQILNQMLRVSVGFEGTDTHGLKAFRRSRILRLVEACKVDKDLFASELVIRVWRSPARIKEIPLQVEEKRKPSINLFRRVPNVLKNMGRLVWIFRVRGDE